MSECEKFVLWLAKDKLGLSYTGRKNDLGEYIMELPEGGTEPYSKEALKASVFPL